MKAEQDDHSKSFGFHRNLSMLRLRWKAFSMRQLCVPAFEQPL